MTHASNSNTGPMNLGLFIDASLHGLVSTGPAPTWNGVLFEPHYVYSPQLIFIGRYETIRMSRQANGPASATPNPSNFGNISTYTVGYRYNPFMTSRAGFAWHNEYNWLHQDGTGPSLGLPNTVNINTSELLLGFDFDF